MRFYCRYWRICRICKRTTVCSSAWTERAGVRGTCSTSCASAGAATNTSDPPSQKYTSSYSARASTTRPRDPGMSRAPTFMRAWAINETLGAKVEVRNWVRWKMAVACASTRNRGPTVRIVAKWPLGFEFIDCISVLPRFTQQRFLIDRVFSLNCLYYIFISLKL